MNTLHEYLTKKFLDWQASIGERKTLEDFADYLDVNRSLLSYWMNGKRIPNEENCEKIAKKLGNEIYDVLDLPRPNPYLQKLNRIWEFIPEDIQKKFSEEAERYEAQNVTERVQRVSKPRKITKTK
jgi:transcriptional regulator with XRE-family HTH domain